jgi:hypothetical protein
MLSAALLSSEQTYHDLLARSPPRKRCSCYGVVCTCESNIDILDDRSVLAGPVDGESLRYCALSENLPWNLWRITPPNSLETPPMFALKVVVPDKKQPARPETLSPKVKDEAKSSSCPSSPSHPAACVTPSLSPQTILPEARDKVCHYASITSCGLSRLDLSDTSTTPSRARLHNPTIVPCSCTFCSPCSNTLTADSSTASTPKKRSRKKVLEPTVKTYVEVTDSDVLFGRGGRSNHHPGNIMFRERLLGLQPAYKKCQLKGKRDMVNGVLDWVKNEQNGRFLAIDESPEGNGRYYVATGKQAREKVSQNLREDHTAAGRTAKKSRRSP